MSGDYSFLKHDIGIVNQSDEVIGLILVKDRNGVPVYLTSDDDYIADPIRGQSNPNKELPPFIQDDFRSGIGLDIYDPSDPYRYNSSVNCDLRFRGQAMLSYAATGLALPATSGAPTCQASFNGVQYIGCGTKLNQVHANGASITNVTTFTSPISALEPFADGFMYVGFEGTTVVSDCETAWTAGSDVTVSLDSGDKKVGTYSNKFVVVDAFTAGTVAYIAFPNLSTYDGVKLWIKCSIDTAAANLQLKFLSAPTLDIPALSAGVWTRVYLKFPATGPAGGNFMYLLSTDIGACTIHIDDIIVEDLIQRMDSGENFTKTTESDGFAHFLKTVNATAPLLWKGLKPNELKSATSPFAASAWSTAKIADSSIYNITDLVSSQNTLHIMKEDRPFYLDSSSNVQVLVDDTKHLASSTGGKNSTSWREKVYMPYGTQSLVEYDSGTITWRDPAKFCASLGDYDGYVRAVAGDEQWLFAILDSATADKVEVLAGRLETIRGTTGWVWHAIAQVAMTDCNMAFVSSIYQRRLWIGSTNSANSIFYIPLPAGYGDPANDTNKLFQTGGYFITPKLDIGFKGDNKAFIKLILKMSGTSSTVYWRAYYKRLGQAAWREINPTDKFKTSPITSGYIPVDADSNNPVSTTIQFKFEGVTDSTASTPILLDYDCRAILYPSRRNLIYCLVKSADGLLCKDGTELASDAKVIRTTLNYAKNTETYPVGFRDINGDTKTVRFLSVDPYSKVTKSEAGRNPEEEYRIVLQEVQLS